MQLHRLVCLDSSTWGLLARDRQTDPDAKRILALFNSGALIPFFTAFHVEEIAQHGDDTIFQSRVGLLKELPFVAFPRRPHDTANVGNILELREAEMAVVVQHPNATHEQIIEIVRPEITNGFCSGEEFCAMNAKWWEIYRKDFARFSQAQCAEIESVTQFAASDINGNHRMPRSPDEYSLRTPEEAGEYAIQEMGSLAERLREHGDKRLRNPDARLQSPDQLAKFFIREVYDEAGRIYEMEGDIVDNLLATIGVDWSRLPKNPTLADVGYESVFSSSFSIHERRLGLPPGTLRQVIHQEMIPSWIVWREVDRAMNRLQKAETSSVNDKMMVPFALYVDGLEVDKRVRDCVRQAVNKHPLLQVVRKKLLRRKNYQDLAQQLEEIGSGD